MEEKEEEKEEKEEEERGRGGRSQEGSCSLLLNVKFHRTVTDCGCNPPSLGVDTLPWRFPLGC